MRVPYVGPWAAACCVLRAPLRCRTHCVGGPFTRATATPLYPMAPLKVATALLTLGLPLLAVLPIASMTLSLAPEATALPGAPTRPSAHCRTVRLSCTQQPEREGPPRAQPQRPRPQLETGSLLHHPSRTD